MRYLRIFLAVLALVLCLAGCSEPQKEANVPTTPAATPAPTPAPTPEPTPEEVYDDATTVAGVDISGLTAQQAVDAVNQKLSEYVFTLKANDDTLTFTAEELEVKIDQQALLAYLTALQDGTELPTAPLATCNGAAAAAKVKKELDRGYTNPSIVFNSSQEAFVISNGRRGKTVDTTGVQQVVEAAIATLQSGTKVQLGTTYIAPTVKDDAPVVIAARDKANSLLLNDLTYHYEAEGITTADVKVTRKDQASFIAISSDYVVSISQNGLDNYVAKIAKNYTGPSSKSAFITTKGYALTSSTYQVPYNKVLLDRAELASDLKYCMENGVSGLRHAKFVPGTTARPYNGTYVEISIDDQHLWFYKNDKLVVSTDVITGKVSAGWGSRTGIFEVNGGKRPNVGLVGNDYYAFVYYWMPYISGVVGMHDCTWHDEFGGDVFIYDGSHGCINMPFNEAKKLFNNMSVGTKVIIYGNTTSMANQVFTGPDTYTATMGDEPFKLDLQVKYTKAALSYVSSDESVITVDENGTVTPVGAGTAKITVTSAAWWNVWESTFEITVTVLPQEVVPSPEPSPESTPEPSPESTPEPSPEPSPESTPESTPESSPEPSPESTPESTPESSAETE